MRKPTRTSARCRRHCFAIAVVDVTTNTVLRHPIRWHPCERPGTPARTAKYLYVSRMALAVDVAVLDTTTGALIGVVDVSQAPGTTTQCVRMSPDGGVSRCVSQWAHPAGLLVVITTRAVRPGTHRRCSQQKSSKPRNQAAARLAWWRPSTSGHRSATSRSAPTVAIAYVASCGSDFGRWSTSSTPHHQITSSRAISEIGEVGHPGER